LAASDPQPTSPRLEREEVRAVALKPALKIGRLFGSLILTADNDRIFENTHLLDATEIFRKLNVHKKVRRYSRYYKLQAEILALT